MDAKMQAKVEQRFVAPIDQTELTVRMIEAATGVRRPAGATAAQAIAGLEKEDVENWMRASTAVLMYVRECIASAQPSN